MSAVKKIAKEALDTQKNLVKKIKNNSIRMMKMGASPNFVHTPFNSNQVKTNRFIEFIKAAKKVILDVYRSLMFRVLLVFVTAFSSGGYLVYTFEHVDGNKDQFVNFWDGIWWGIVTITTTGYGDKFPATLWGRLIAGAIMLVGIVTTGIVTGNLASWLVDRRLKEARGLVNLTGKYGHIVICGWRREMDTVIGEIMHLSPWLKPDDIVIIAPISQETLESFKSDERFAGTHILRGDYFSQTMLEHASVKFARKVLILSDWSNPHATVTEVDAKTVMTAMTVEKIAPTVYVAAEVIDKQFENYLKLAHCDEVIHSKQFSRAMITNSTKYVGMSHVLYDLLNIDTAANLETAPIPEAFVGKTFVDLAAHIRHQEAAILIGLVENTGNIHAMKKEALGEAQKNPNTRTVLKNLAQVKHLTTNLPVMNPPRDYVIKRNSMAVLVSNSETKARLIHSKDVS